MKIEDVFEGISDVVFHFTGLNNFFSMVREGNINLSRSHGAENLINSGYDYFLSTTRSRQGASFFHRNHGINGVILTLDGRRLQQNLKGAPTNYWGSTDNTSDEMEDRILSNLPSIELDRYTLKADILLNDRQIEDESFVDRLSSLKYERFPIYVYDTRRDWVIGRPEKASYIIKDGRFKVNLQMLMNRN